jgi:CBS domain-containing protein
MTVNPKCCEPGDSAVRAAQIMKDEDVGPVPVVNNQNEKRIVGIVTDRDLAIEVVATGRDPNSTRIEEIMTRRPVTCHRDDDAHDAMDAMSRNQVRRIPVVDDHEHLVGIIAQADLARMMDEEDVGEVVEDISQPGRNPVSRTFSRMANAGQTYYSSTPAARVLVAVGVGMATGATLMCLLDPSRGRERRERVSSAARNAYDQSASLVNKAKSRAEGWRRYGQRRSEQRMLSTTPTYEPLGL